MWKQDHWPALAAAMSAHALCVAARFSDRQPLRWEKNQWINVKDRLPDLIPCNAGTAYSEAVIAWTSGRKAMIAVWDGSDWVAPFDYWEAWGEEITHWMPLPEPPKGG